MAASNDDLLISISTDLTAVKRQLKQLTTDIGTTTSGIQKQFDGMGKAIDQSMTPVQKRINDMMGIASTGAKPLKEWKGALADAASGLEKTGHAAGATSTSMQAMLHSIRSVGEQLALGVSPAQALTGQLSHLSYVASQPGGIGAALKGVGDMATGLVTKFPEVAAAVGAVGLAFAAYELMSVNGVKTLDEILKTHEANILRLGDAYDEVAGKRKKYASDTALTVNQLNKQGAQDAADLLSKQALDILGKVDANLVSFDSGGRFAAFAEPIKKLMEELRNGTPDIKAFRNSINEIANANPGLDARRQEILGFSQAAADTAAQMPDLARSVSDVTDTVNAFALQLASVDSKPLQKDLQDLFDKASEGKQPIDDILNSLAALEQANPNFSGIIAGFAGILKAAADTAAALDALGSKYFANQGTPTNGRQKLPVGILPDTVDVVPTHANKEDLGAGYDKAAAKEARKHKFHAPAKTADDQFANDIKSIQDRTAALNEEFNALGLTYEAQTKRKTALELEQTALKQVREEARKKGDVDWQNAQLTPAQIKEIDDVSAAYARQADALKKAQEMQALQRDVLKGAFDDLRSALESGQLSWKTFADIATHALDKIIDKIENDLIDSIMQANNAGGGGSIFGSLLGLLTGSGGSSSFGTPGGFAQMLGIPGYANGTSNHPGGLAIVGERGPELLNLPRGSQVMPRVPSINAAGGSSQTNNITFAPVIDARGAQKGAGDEIQAALKAFQKDFTMNTVKAIRAAKVRGMI
ncbi:hypothetical protein OOJ09_25955 [Mesorhizobium qingshengii]|uniref:Prophage tail length tape measure protein n=1 Tax=Mesorhizobium qingshengii TaxID=1165689 RepID=A0ABT4R1J6_9HYPH|nr:hypothetical protein [Mesorhizobium qingshengii]MCZ8547645.1 hypothetical protein [Mesorhizobium qingshengii]